MPSEANFWSRNSGPKAQAKLQRLAKQFDADLRSIRAIFGLRNDFDKREEWPTDDGALLPEDELEHLISQGWLPDQAVLSSRPLLEWFFDERASITKEEVVRTFIAGLNNKRYDYHSPLGSFACFFHVQPENAQEQLNPDGAETWPGAQSPTPRELLQEAYTRLNCQYGHGDLLYSAYDFWQFNRQPTPEPLDEDQQTLRKALDAIRSLPANAKLSELQKSLSGIVKGNNRDRQHILEILGYCGVLGTHDGIPMRDRYVSRLNSPMPEHFYSREWHYPASFWNGTVGIDESEVAFWFPGLER